jgi:hypothetical protein
VTEELLSQLDADGIVALPALLDGPRLRSMQQAFAARLARQRWNDCDGYERTELFRHMLQDVLLLDQGFVDLALHPLVKSILHMYLGAQFRLTEAKGWKSLPTRRSFHGWHGDAWYDQTTVREIPREVKLAMYLTDVESGHFEYVTRTHRQQHPKNVSDEVVARFDPARIARMRGPAGTAFLFDTSGIHRQSEPVLKERRAIFYNYHDPGVPLQAEDVAYYRYHPLLLNAAFLGGLSNEDARVLGFGDRSHYVHAFRRHERFPWLQNVVTLAHGVRLRADDLFGRVRARLARR